MRDAEYVTYHTAPLGSGAKALRAKLYFPKADADPAAPLSEPKVLVWFPRGGFQESNIDAPTLDRIGRLMGRQGYASAFVETRVGADDTDLLPITQDHLPDLMAEAARAAPDLPDAYTGAAALAAMEDGAAFLRWLDSNRAVFGLPESVLLGGASTGGITVLNLLNLAPALGISDPTLAPPRAAVVVSGGYGYPTYLCGRETRLLAVHAPGDTEIPPGSIRAYAHAAGSACTLVEVPGQHHGELRQNPQEVVRRGIRRIARFDTGTDLGFDDEAHFVAQDAPRIAMVASVGSDGPYLLEWIAHHKRLGVTDFILVSQPSPDGTRAFLDALKELGLVEHIESPAADFAPGRHRDVAAALARFSHGVRQADYVIHADVTDFVEVDAGRGTLGDLLAARGGPDALTLPSLRFGFCGVGRYADAPVVGQFDAAMAAGSTLTIRRTGTSSVAAPVPGGFARVRRYPFRSVEAFLVRLATQTSGSARLPYRTLTAWNAGLSPQPPLTGFPDTKAAYDALLADEVVSSYHHACVEWHRSAIAELWADPATAEVWGAIAHMVGPIHPVGPIDPQDSETADDPAVAAE